jgi:hypothetical protein
MVSVRCDRRRRFCIRDPVRVSPGELEGMIVASGNGVPPAAQANLPRSREQRTSDAKPTFISQRTQQHRQTDFD